MTRRPSLYPTDGECFVCHTTRNIETHHIYPGSNRDRSDHEGCTVQLCHDHHQHPRFGAHGWDKRLDHWLRRDCQRRWEEREGATDHEAFRRLFYQSYL